MTQIIIPKIHTKIHVTSCSTVRDIPALAEVSGHLPLAGGERLFAPPLPA